ncbi:hypothetical protein SCOCK_300021 [Actinacidiphila cocklensis]|uniref:Uncharacterized protein n=1 Tax=Actinacidiphila cocklensis TaxID=887465 RepID=A0A9W4GRX3_9ACTN|nr:hypothetical protein SCOCK_300021 [Actinacidiphila cocklensis]
MQLPYRMAPVDEYLELARYRHPAVVPVRHEHLWDRRRPGRSRPADRLVAHLLLRPLPGLLVRLHAVCRHRHVVQRYSGGVLDPLTVPFERPLRILRMPITSSTLVRAYLPWPPCCRMPRLTQRSGGDDDHPGMMITCALETRLPGRVEHVRDAAPAADE